MKLLIATPAANAVVTTQYAGSLARLCRELAQRGIEFDYFTTSFANLPMARNMMASRALARGFSHVLFADADMGFRPQAVMRMFAHGAPVIGAVCVQRHTDPVELVKAAAASTDRAPGWERRLVSNHMHYTGEPLVIDGRKTIAVRGGFAEFFQVGTGLMLIACSALSEIVAKAQAHRHTASFVKVDYPLFGFFDHMHDRNGDEISEDYSFCLRWRACGGTVWAMLDEPIFHIGPFEHIGNFADTLAAPAGPAA